MEEHYWYVVLNPTDDTHDLVAYKELLDTYNDIKSYCLSYEVSDDNHQHYHLYLHTPTDRETWRGRFRSKFRAVARFSKKEVQNKVRAIAYTIKDGNYYTRNLDVNVFLMAKEVSHPKKPKYEHALRAIDERYLSGELSLEGYYRSLLKLNVEYRRKTYLQHIRAHALTIKHEKSIDFLENSVKKLMEDDL